MKYYINTNMKYGALKSFWSCYFFFIVLQIGLMAKLGLLIDAIR